MGSNGRHLTRYLPVTACFLLLAGILLTNFRHVSQHERKVVASCRRDVEKNWRARVPRWIHEGSLQSARQGIPAEGGQHYSQQGEDAYAYSNFFHGLVAGTYLEMGALDGVRYSNTFWYHKHLAWHGLLIEGSPKSYASLLTNRPNDIVAHAAVCGERTTVHYLECDDGAVSGIAEFMSDTFKQQFAAQLDKAVKTDIACLPLGDILAYHRIAHVNFFSLDVEGGELMVLQSIDFNCFSFDVMVVELDGSNPNKDDAVRQLLLAAGYVSHSRVTNNDWFVRRGFNASTRSL